MYLSFIPQILRSGVIPRVILSSEQKLGNHVVVQISYIGKAYLMRIDGINISIFILYGKS